MDGMFAPRPDASDMASTSLLGILYAEDFDELPGNPTTPHEQPAEVVRTPTSLTEADLERACAAAVAEARAGWEQEAHQHRTHVLATLAQAVGTAQQHARDEAASLAEGTVTTMLSLLSSALPHFCRTHGPAEVRTLLHRLLPHLRTEPQVIIRVHPSLVASVQDDIARSDAELTGVFTVTAAPLEPGDVRVTWQNGSFKRDTAAVLTSMQDALSQLGLAFPVEITPKRRMELAE